MWPLSLSLKIIWISVALDGDRIQVLYLKPVRRGGCTEVTSVSRSLIVSGLGGVVAYGPEPGRVEIKVRNKNKTQGHRRQEVSGPWARLTMLIGVRLREKRSRHE